MARSDAAALLASTGLPVVYYQWPDGSTPTFPCIRYVSEGSNDLHADNMAYAKFDKWSATLVSERKDDASEALIEATLDDAGVTYSRLGDTWITEESLMQVEYEFMLPR